MCHFKESHTLKDGSAVTRKQWTEDSDLDGQEPKYKSAFPSHSLVTTGLYLQDAEAHDGMPRDFLLLLFCCFFSPQPQNGPANSAIPDTKSGKLDVVEALELSEKLVRTSSVVLDSHCYHRGEGVAGYSLTHALSCNNSSARPIDRRSAAPASHSPVP